MMRFIRSLFSRKPVHHQPEGSLSATFAAQVQYAIQLLANEEGTLTNEEVLQLFRDHNIRGKLAEDILLFLPIAFVRHLLPDIQWHNSYTEMMDSQHAEEKEYSKTPAFLIIWAVTEAYFRQSPDAATIVKIGGRSAEFHVINQLVLDGNQPKDIRLTETVLIRRPDLY